MIATKIYARAEGNEGINPVLPLLNFLWQFENCASCVGTVILYKINNTTHIVSWKLMLKQLKGTVQREAGKIITTITKQKQKQNEQTW